MATKAPARVSYSEFWIACASARSPVFCSSLSIVRRSRWPCLGSVTDSLRSSSREPNASTTRRVEPSVPRRYLSYWYSRPLCPIRVPWATSLYLRCLHLLRADLGDRAEQLGGELALGVLAQVALRDDDALEVLRALAHEVELGERDVRADRDVRVRRVGDAADHALVDRLRADVDRLADAAVELGELGLVARDLGDRDLAGRGAELLQPACARAPRPSSSCARRRLSWRTNASYWRSYASRWFSAAASALR